MKQNKIKAVLWSNYFPPLSLSFFVSVSISIYFLAQTYRFSVCLCEYVSQNMESFQV